MLRMYSDPLYVLTVALHSAALLNGSTVKALVFSLITALIRARDLRIRLMRRCSVIQVD